ncbi:hypothetical protein ACFLRZ_05855, partial [Bacteroidota bacterium]
SGFCEAQQFILLSHKGHNKQLKYYVGNTIHIRIKNKQHISGQIILISDSLLIIDRIKVIPEDISDVYFDRRLLSLLSSAGKTVGLGYFVVESFNNVINGEKTIIAKREILASAIIGGSGIFLSLFNERKCCLEKMWRLKIIDFNVFNVEPLSD